MNSRISFLFIIGMLVATTLNGQEIINVKKREFKKKEQKDGFKEAWKSIKEGDKYFEQGKGTYNLARDHYLFANQYNNNNAELNYKIGDCYLFGDDKFQAIDYFLNAYQINPEVSPDIKFKVGRAYHMAEEFDKAMQFYRDYKKGLPLKEDLLELNNEIDYLIVQCDHGLELVKNPLRVIVQNLGESVNSQHDDYNGRFAFNDTALFFTSRRPIDKKSKRSELDNKYFENVFISSHRDGNFQPAYLAGKPFLTGGNSSIVGISPDGNSVFIYIGEEGGDIQQVMFNPKKGKWRKPESISKHIDTDAAETTAALAPGGKELYFVSANPEMTNGGKDIYITRKNAKGKWGEPRNLGSLINSQYDEEGVFLTSDGRTMYFASKGHNSMGGFDIFMSVLEEDEVWGKPVNIGYPINTPEDEIFYVTDSSTTYGYFSATREGGFGGKDIYKVIYLGKEKELSLLTSDQLIAGTESTEKNPFLTLPTLLERDTTLLLSGQVRDSTGGADTTVMAVLSFMDPASGELVTKTMTGADGYYKARLTEPKVYGVEINATGYLYYLDIIDLSAYDRDDPVEKDFYLQRIEVGTKVVLDNIYFETGKAILTIDSYEALDQVFRFLENNGSVRLEISGHTDNTGSRDLNMNLSEARAKAVVDFIAERGISRARLEYKGYADAQPVSSNDSPEGREMNRRVEFKILSK
jgi:outer membrane protein OmpA-like peptidoglycan-associated protein/tetratricopeptide (TPR) repeat protein